MNPLAARIHAWYGKGGYPQHIIAAALLCADSPTILGKIGGYVDEDGWIEFDRLAEYVDVSPWSGGEMRLIRFACSLAGYPADILSNDWLLGNMLGFDPDDVRLVLEAFRYAMEGERS